MIEMQDYSGAIGQSSLEEPMHKEIEGAADKWRRLKLKWERACKKYESALKMEASTAESVRKSINAKSAAQRALNSLMKIKLEIDRFTLENKATKDKVKEPFFVGIINFAQK